MAVTLEKIHEALEETKRFLQKVEAAKQRFEVDSFATYGCKESGALIRASMDMTLALVELRKV